MDPQTFQAARRSDRRAKNRVRVPMNETLEWPKSFRHKKSWPAIGPGKNLAIFLRSRLSDAVDARRVPFTNRFPHREELRLAMQMRAARYVKYFVILILRYCDRLRNLARIQSARGVLLVLRRYDQPPGREHRQSQWYSRSGG